MGLDIHAASHLQYVRPIPEGDEFDRLQQEALSQDKCLSELCFLLDANDGPWADRLGGMVPGLYEYTPATRQHEFRVGSCSVYNEWRERLSRYALDAEPDQVWDEPGQYSGKPFVELVNFTDCDGRIAGRVAAKLAADFRDHADSFKRFVAREPDADWCVHIYDEFAAAFELASQEGAFQFC